MAVWSTLERSFPSREELLLKASCLHGSFRWSYLALSLTTLAPPGHNQNGLVLKTTFFYFLKKEVEAGWLVGWLAGWLAGGLVGCACSSSTVRDSIQKIHSNVETRHGFPRLPRSSLWHCFNTFHLADSNGGVDFSNLGRLKSCMKTLSSQIGASFKALVFTRQHSFCGLLMSFCISLRLR